MTVTAPSETPGPEPSAERMGGGENARTREHLANERTLLSWIRTAIAMMGLGFVVARFALFLRELAVQPGGAPVSTPGLSTWIGIAMVFGGVLAGALGAYRYFRVRDQIERADFEPEAFVDIVVLTVTLLAGLALALYLALNS
jgi:putative membrane protein